MYCLLIGLPSAFAIAFECEAIRMATSTGALLSCRNDQYQRAQTAVVKLRSDRRTIRVRCFIISGPNRSSRQRGAGLVVVGFFGFDTFAVAGVVFDAGLGLPDHRGACLVVVGGPEGELAVLGGGLLWVV